MKRNDNFAFRVSNIERAMIADLARRLRRSQGDAIRLVIREAVISLQAQDGAPIVETGGEVTQHATTN